MQPSESDERTAASDLDDVLALGLAIQFVPCMSVGNEQPGLVAKYDASKHKVFYGPNADSLVSALWEWAAGGMADWGDETIA